MTRRLSQRERAELAKEVRATIREEMQQLGTALDAIRLEQFQIRPRAVKALAEAGITTLGDVRGKTSVELLRIQGLGILAADQIGVVQTVLDSLTMSPAHTAVDVPPGTLPPSPTAPGVPRDLLGLIDANAALVEALRGSQEFLGTQVRSQLNRLTEELAALREENDILRADNVVLRSQNDDLQDRLARRGNGPT